MASPAAAARAARAARTRTVGSGSRGCTGGPDEVLLGLNEVAGRNIRPTQVRPQFAGEELAHGHAELERGLIELFARLALLIEAHGLHHIRREHTVDEEAWTAFDDQRQLVDGSDEGAENGPDQGTHQGCA